MNDAPLRPQFLTPIVGTLVPWGEFSATLRKGSWHLHALHRLDGAHSGLIAIRFPDEKQRYLALDLDILALQLIAALLPPKVHYRVAELAVEFDAKKANVIARSTTSH